MQPEQAKIQILTYSAAIETDTTGAIRLYVNVGQSSTTCEWLKKKLDGGAFVQRANPSEDMLLFEWEEKKSVALDVAKIVACKHSTRTVANDCADCGVDLDNCNYDCHANREGDCDWMECPQKQHYKSTCPLALPLSERGLS